MKNSVSEIDIKTLFSESTILNKIDLIKINPLLVIRINICIIIIRPQQYKYRKYKTRQQRKGKNPIQKQLR